jgi:hypothetical protein
VIVCKAIELREAEVNAWIQDGLLKRDTRHRLRAVAEALYPHLDRSLDSGR